MSAASTVTYPGTIAIRPAQPEDIAQIAALLVQLYEAELPGALIGPLEKQVSLLRFTLEANQAHALRQRYVACVNDAVVATGMIQQPTDPSFERAPDRTLRMALALLGYRAAARLLLTVARSVAGVHQQRGPDSVLFHSVVVHQRQRGRGIGRRLMAALEQNAAAQGYQHGVLQVLAENTGARQLYLRLGYQDIWRSPRWVGLLSWPSFVMRKAVQLDEGGTR